jgi:4-aminobutyrate aminotransferase-like enzyme
VEPFTPPFEEAEATAAPVLEAIERLASRGHRPAALFLDTAYTSDGILAPGAGYHAGVAEAAHEAGALVVADEVQAGYGRTGEHLWSFVACGLQPDLVTLGKPMGNGHPVAAVIARRDDVDRLAGQAEFFSTFGGNPVAATAGLAVLDVIRDQDLIARAASVGAHARAGLEALREKHPSIAVVRGRGLLLGVELVRDDGEPDRELAARVLDGARDRGVMIGSTGRHSNVLKVRPPLVVGPAEADMIVAAIDDSLASLA